MTLIALHTPGPWEVLPAGFFGDDGALGIRANDISRAPVANVFLDAPWLSNETSANARLIAAAPALYDACVAAEAWLVEAVADDEENTPPLPSGLAAVLAALRAALAAANPADGMMNVE